jgi:hypothetical protein
MSYFKWGAVLCSAVVLAAGCKGKTEPDTSNYKTAINNYYSAHPSCVWPSAVKFPAQVDASDDSQTKGFDALTDAGLLTRKAEEKKRFLIGSKQVTDYDVSDKGRTMWVADQTQPGYGNFCYGHRDVIAIDNASTPANQSGSNTVIVNYHYQLAGVPDWARSAETQSAFPNVQSDLAASKADTATLLQTQNGWQMSSRD